MLNMFHWAYYFPVFSSDRGPWTLIYFRKKTNKKYNTIATAPVWSTALLHTMHMVICFWPAAS